MVIKQYIFFSLAVGCVSFSVFAAADKCHPALEQHTIRFSREGHADHVEEFPYNVALRHVQERAATLFGIAVARQKLTYPTEAGNRLMRTELDFQWFKAYNKMNPCAIQVSCWCDKGKCR